MLAFTTRLPLAVMIAMGIKQWENRSAMPTPAQGTCAMTVSKSSFASEYEFFLEWAERKFPMEVFNALPEWRQVSGWRGKLIAVCDYDASYTPRTADLERRLPRLVALDGCPAAERTAPPPQKLDNLHKCKKRVF